MLKFKLTRVDESLQEKLDSQILENFKAYIESHLPMGYSARRDGEEIYLVKNATNLGELLFPENAADPKVKEVSSTIDSETFFKEM